jgi:excisionase family DNA binding protein
VTEPEPEHEPEPEPEPAVEEEPPPPPQPVIHQFPEPVHQEPAPPPPPPPAPEYAPAEDWVGIEDQGSLFPSYTRESQRQEKLQELTREANRTRGRGGRRKSTRQEKLTISRDELLQNLLDPIITLDETAVILGVCKTTVRRYTNKGLIQHIRTPGGQRRFRLSDVINFMNERTRG